MVLFLDAVADNSTAASFQVGTVVVDNIADVLVSAIAVVDLVAPHDGYSALSHISAVALSQVYQDVALELGVSQDVQIVLATAHYFDT